VFVMAAATSWYASIPTLGFAVAVLALLAALWGPVYLARPRRALVYRMSPPQYLFTLGPAPVNGSVGPRLLGFRLSGSGRQDVPSSAFDGTPIIFSLDNGKILSLDEDSIMNQPEDRIVPTARIEDGKLLIGPSLIGRDQVILWEMLAEYEGSVPLYRVQGALIDVRLRPTRPTARNFAIEAVSAGIGSWFLILMMHLSLSSETKSSYRRGFYRQLASWFLHGSYIWAVWLTIALILMGAFSLTDLYGKVRRRRAQRS
jgi:hypothetical protein